MTDNLTKKQRQKCMKRIKAKNTKPEKIVRKGLWSQGYRGYRLHRKLPGKPDITFGKYDVAIFIDGCFWHKCPQCYQKPKSNKDYWIPKIEKNVKRDKKNNKELKKKGWKVVRIWEHEVKRNFDNTMNDLFIILDKYKQSHEQN